MGLSSAAVDGHALKEVTITVIVLAGRSSGDHAVSLVWGEAPLHRSTELWRGEATGRCLLYHPEPEPLARPRDRRWSAGPPSPFDRAERLVFLGDVTREPMGQPCEWMEVTRAAMQVAALSGEGGG